MISRLCRLRRSTPLMTIGMEEDSPASNHLGPSSPMAMSHTRKSRRATLAIKSASRIRAPSAAPGQRRPNKPKQEHVQTRTASNWVHNFEPRAKMATDTNFPRRCNALYDYIAHEKIKEDCKHNSGLYFPTSPWLIRIRISMRMRSYTYPCTHKHTHRQKPTYTYTYTILYAYSYE